MRCAPRLLGAGQLFALFCRGGSYGAECKQRCFVKFGTVAVYHVVEVCIAMSPSRIWDNGVVKCSVDVLFIFMSAAVDLFFSLFLLPPGLVPSFTCECLIVLILS